MNFLTQEEQGRVRDAYGPNYDRLAAIKAKYDPTNVFRVNQNILPVPAATPRPSPGHLAPASAPSDAMNPGL